MVKQNKVNKGVGVVYCRTATEEGVEKGGTLSKCMQEQSRECLSKLQGEGYKVLEVINDSGKSGANLKREGMQRVLELIKGKKIQAVCMVRSDRISRNCRDNAYVRDLAGKSDVKLIYTQQVSSRASLKMSENVLKALNEYQSQLHSEKIKAGLKKRKRRLQNNNK